MSADVIRFDCLRVVTLEVGSGKEPQEDGLAHQVLTRGSNFLPRLVTLVPRDTSVHPKAWHVQLAVHRQLVDSADALLSAFAYSGHGWCHYLLSGHSAKAVC